MKLLPKPFVLVRWSDAHCVSGATEMSEHEIPHAAAHYTVGGWVLRQDEVGITIAGEYSDEATYRSINFIPAGMIVEVVPVKLSIIKPKVTVNPAPPASPIDK